MADFDVSMRFGIDYRRDDARELRRDLDKIQKAAARFGSAGGDRLGRGFQDAGDAADKAKRKVEGLAGAEDRLKSADGTQVLARELTRLSGTFDRTSERAAELRQVVDRLKSVEGATAVERDLKGVERASDKVRERLGVLRTAVTDLGDTPGARDLAEALDRLGGRAETAEVSIDGIRNAVRRLGSETGAEELRQDLGQVESAGRQAERQIEKIADAEQRLGRGGAGGLRARYGAGARDFAQEAIGNTGAGATLLPFIASPYAAAGAGLAGAGYGVYKTTGQAISLEAAMADVKRQVPEGTNLDALEGGILRLSEDLGVPKEQLAALVANAAKTGTSADKLLPFAGYASKFAVAADMGQDEAGSTIGMIRAQFGVEQDRVPEILDSINYLADKSNTQERLLLQFAGRASQNVEIGTFSPEQITAFGTGFLNVGVAPEVAGTGFNALISRLGDASGRARSDKDFRRSLGRLGLNAREVQTDFYDDSSSTVLDLLERVKKLPKEQRLSALRGLGGDEYADDFTRLAGQTDNIRGFLADADSPAAKGSVDAAFKVYNDTTARQFAKATASLASLGAELGKTFLPAVRDFAAAVARFAGGWAESIRDGRMVDRAADAAREGTDLTPEDRARLKEREGADRERRRQTLEMLGAGEVKATGDVKSVVSDEIDQIRKEIAAKEKALAARPEVRPGLPGGVVVDPAADNLRFQIEQLKLSIEDLTRQMRDAGKPDAIKPEKVGFFDGQETYGTPRVINASYGGRGSSAPFRSSYAGAPQMDGFAGMGASGPSANDNARFGGSGSPRGTYGTAAPLLDLIGRSEGTDKGDGYDETLGYGAYTGGDVNLSGMSLDEIDKLQTGMLNDPDNRFNSSAVGRYQIVRKTLRQLREQLGLSGDQKFNKPTQDMLATELARQRGLDDYLDGDMSEDKFLDSLSKEWASLPNSNGRGHYGGQRASVSTDDVRGALASMGSGDNAASSARRFGAKIDPSGISLDYTNDGATRNRPVTDELFASIQEGIASVYGEGYRGEIYSGGQAGRHRTGSRRHDDHGHGGRASDTYIYDPDGKRLKGDDLAPLAQWWLANKKGSVGLEMNGGGIHLDELKSKDLRGGESLHWDYGRLTKGQSQALRKGMAGVQPHLTKPDAAAVADGAAAHGVDSTTYGADGWPTDDRLRPAPKPRSRPGKSAEGAGNPASGQAGAGKTGQQMVTNHHYHGVDPQVQAAAAARRQRREIAAAQARAMHDTQPRVA